MSSTSAIIVTFIFSIVFPIGLMIWWKKKTGEGIWSFAAGAICFTVFAMILERLLHQAVLGGTSSLARKITASPVLTMVYAALMAGIFEETGRLFGFKVLLKDKKEPSTAIAYGIGHGGIEVILLLGMTYLSLLLAVLGVDFGNTAVNTALLDSARSITFATAAVAMLPSLLNFIVFPICSYPYIFRSRSNAIALPSIPPIPTGPDSRESDVLSRASLRMKYSSSPSDIGYCAPSDP